MAIKSILVPVTGDGQDRRCLDAAAVVAGADGAHITLLFGEINPAAMPVIYGGDGVGFYLTEEFLQALTERNDLHRQRAQEVYAAWTKAAGIAADMVGEGVPKAATARFVSVPAEATNAVRDFAVVNDLVVTMLPDPTALERADQFEAALFTARKPVLAVPREGPLPLPGTPAAIAWNGSPEASRAATVALPLLRRAGSVILLHTGSTEIAPVIEFLGRHGVTATAQALQPGSGDIGAALLAEAGRLGASLLVLGAYGHSRARELIFGGVTRHALQHAGIPLLLTH
jgi:nucleotide-binding universal stress UspA family protein